MSAQEPSRTAKKAGLVLLCGSDFADVVCRRMNARYRQQRRSRRYDSIVGACAIPNAVLRALASAAGDSGAMVDAAVSAFTYQVLTTCVPADTFSFALEFALQHGRPRATVRQICRSGLGIMPSLLEDYLRAPGVAGKIATWAVDNPNGVMLSSIESPSARAIQYGYVNVDVTGCAGYGSISARDADPMAAAIREAMEEMELDPDMTRKLLEGSEEDFPPVHGNVAHFFTAVAVDERGELLHAPDWVTATEDQLPDVGGLKL